jgi:hypothetical protein
VPSDSSFSALLPVDAIKQSLAGGDNVSLCMGRDEFDRMKNDESHQTPIKENDGTVGKNSVNK